MHRTRMAVVCVVALVGLCVFLVFLFGSHEVTAARPTPTPTPELYRVGGRVGWATVYRLVDAEAGIVCYVSSEGLQCVPIESTLLTK